MDAVVAIPSVMPGGLEAPVDAHFGHCGIYTLVTLKDGQVDQVRLLPTVPHEQGGCLSAVNYLAQQGVNILISGGMGLRPLMGFNQAGIEVYYRGLATTVAQAAEALAQGKLTAFTQDQVCGGGGGDCAGH